MAESEEEPESLLMKMKGEQKTDLKLNIQKTKIMASSSITSWQRELGKGEATPVQYTNAYIWNLERW